MSSLRASYGKIANPMVTPIQESLTLDGTSSGSNNAAVLGTLGTPVEFYYQALPNTIATINKVGYAVGDVGNTGYDDYGTITGPLVNGINFFTELDGVVSTFPVVVRAAVDFFDIGANVEIVELSGNKRIADYSFRLLNYSQGIVLNGDRGDKFGVRIRDNLTSLPHHVISINGNFRIIGV